MKTIEEIKNTPLFEREVNEEYRLAKHEGRQPLCVYCGKPLEIDQTQYDDISWKWDDEKKRYVKTNNGTADEPYCLECGVRDWNFIDEDAVNF